jgi:hypothetical protein
MSKLDVGARVRVQIGNHHVYAQGAAQALDGMTGVVERFRADGEALVAFDRPAPTWWTHQTAWTAGWFHPSDLVRL